MSQKEIELILTRQLASYLAMPIIIVDPKGRLIFFNEPAEPLIGRSFNETGEMPVQEWSALFKTTDKHGKPLGPEQLPFGVALNKRRPCHVNFWVQSLDNTRRNIEVTAFPLIGQQDRLLGAMGVFWEVVPDAG